MHGESNKKITELRTVDGKGHDHLFYYTVSEDQVGHLQEWQFIVTDAPGRSSAVKGDFYDLIVRHLDAQTVQVASMENRDIPVYRGKGITEALIPEVARVLRRDVVSSRVVGDDFSERRTEYATIIWERLVAAGIAIDEGERYRVTYVGSDYGNVTVKLGE